MQENNELNQPPKYAPSELEKGKINEKPKDYKQEKWDRDQEIRDLELEKSNIKKYLGTLNKPLPDNFDLPMPEFIQKMSDQELKNTKEKLKEVSTKLEEEIRKN